MDNLGSTDVFLAIGMKGCGKSYLARKIQDAYPRVVVFDTLCEYGDEEENIVSDFHSFTDRLEKLDRDGVQNFRIIYQFDPESITQDDEFNHALRVLYYKGSLQIVLEEVQEFCGVHGMPHWLKRCILTGRHRDLSLIFTTQRPGELHKSLLSQCKHVFFGQLFEKNDLEYCRAILRDSFIELPRLKPREFMHFSPGKPVQKMSNDLRPIPQSVNQNRPALKESVDISDNSSED